MTMDAAYKTPWIMEKILDDGRIPIVPYTCYQGKKDVYKPWEFPYDEGQDCFICPRAAGCGIQPQARMERVSTAARPRTAGTAPAGRPAAPMQRASAS